MTEFTYKLGDLPDVVEAIIPQLNSKVVLLFGELGAGKTTLLKCICEQLGVTDKISSPTFAIVHEYMAKTGPIYHLDCYRIEAVEELENLRVTEYLESGNWVFVEWPEKLISLITENYVSLRVSRNADNTRTLNLKHA